MSYTKGPWTVQGGMVWASVKKINDSGQEYVESAIVADTWHSKKLPDDEKEANANLVATSTELLEALKDCYRALIAQGCHLDNQMPLSERLDVAKRAQEVIAKAEGRTE